MSHPSDEVSIHTKRYYRVILDGVDSDLESLESFAVKLAARGHVTLSRARVAVSRFPYTVKSNLTASQANRLKTLLEEIGGKVRIEAHYVTPGHFADAGRGITQRRLREKVVVCRDCGSTGEPDATYCSFCHRKFRDPLSRPETLEQRIPEENPLDIPRAADEMPWARIFEAVRRRRLAILAAVAVILLGVIIILK
jgi:ribosomal protein L40E